MALAVISMGLVGLMFVPPPAPCLTDGVLEVHVGDTAWLLPTAEAGGLSLKRRGRKVCEPVDGVIVADVLTIKDAELQRIHLSISPHRGGTIWTDAFAGKCSKEPFVTVAGDDLGQQCNAYKAINAETIARITYYTADWPPEKWPELFRQVDARMAEARKTGIHP